MEEFYYVWSNKFDGSSASPENRIIYGKTWYVNVAGLAEVFNGVDWTIVKNSDLIWILNALDDMSCRDTLLATAVASISKGEFITKWEKLNDIEKNLSVLTSGVGVLLQYVSKDHAHVIRERTAKLRESERTKYPLFHPCSDIEGLDFSKYYFNLEIHQIDCWHYNCVDSDCYCCGEDCEYCPD